MTLNFRIQDPRNKFKKIKDHAFVCEIGHGKLKNSCEFCSKVGVLVWFCGKVGVSMFDSCEFVKEKRYIEREKTDEWEDESGEKYN